jgi:hypothetical protein
VIYFFLKSFVSALNIDTVTVDESIGAKETVLGVGEDNSSMGVKSSPLWLLATGLASRGRLASGLPCSLLATEYVRRFGDRRTLKL